MRPALLASTALLASVALVGTGPAAHAAPYVLTTGTDDGQVTVGVDGYGLFGRAGGTNTSDASHNPVGAIGAAGTTYQSGVAI